MSSSSSTTSSIALSLLQQGESLVISSLPTIATVPIAITPVIVKGLTYSYQGYLSCMTQYSITSLDPTVNDLINQIFTDNTSITGIITDISNMINNGSLDIFDVVHLISLLEQTMNNLVNVAKNDFHATTIVFATRNILLYVLSQIPAIVNNTILFDGILLLIKSDLLIKNISTKTTTLLNKIENSSCCKKCCPCC